MKRYLKEKQTEFLELLQTMNGIDVLKLSPADRILITETLSVGYYYDHEQRQLNRLRTRCKEPRPNADSDEFY